MDRAGVTNADAGCNTWRQPQLGPLNPGDISSIWNESQVRPALSAAPDRNREEQPSNYLRSCEVGSRCEFEPATAVRSIVPAQTALKPSRHTPPIQRCLLHGPVWFVGSLCQRRFTRSLGLLCLTAEQHGSIGKLLAYLLLISNQTMFTGYHPTTPEIPSFVFNRNEKTATELDK